MARNTRLENAVLNVRTAMAFGRGRLAAEGRPAAVAAQAPLGRLRALSRR